MPGRARSVEVGNRMGFKGELGCLGRALPRQLSHGPMFHANNTVAIGRHFGAREAPPHPPGGWARSGWAGGVGASHNEQTRPLGSRRTHICIGGHEVAGFHRRVSSLGVLSPGSCMANTRRCSGCQRFFTSGSRCVADYIAAPCLRVTLIKS